MSDSRSQPRAAAHVSVPNDPRALQAVKEEVLAAVSERAYPEAAAFAIRLALEEAVQNAYQHGNQSDPARTVGFEWRIAEKSMTVTIEDEGTGFTPGVVPDPTDPERLEIPSGRGLLLMRAYMTDVQYNDRGNRVTMTYERQAP
ncbi:MAG: ATP-binding protein [Phycisphaerales bacterium]|nr:ATP-binding protein [Phycisphaerales bacterium]